MRAAVYVQALVVIFSSALSSFEAAAQSPAALDAKCVADYIATAGTSLSSGVEDLLAICALPAQEEQECSGPEAGENSKVVSLLMWENIASPFQKVAEEWSSAQPDVTVVVLTVKLGELTDELVRQAQERTSIYDGFIYNPGLIADLYELGGLENLNTRIKADASSTLDWPDISRFFRDQAALYDQKPVAIPLDGDLLNVYYRRDLLEDAGFDVPATWEDYLAVAEHFNGTDLNEDSEPDYGSCLGTVPGCALYYLATSMAVSMLQYNGTDQGIWVDPVNLQPFFGTPATEIAYSWLQRAVDLGPPDANSGCVKINKKYFHAGRCAITVAWGDLLTEAYTEPVYVQGRIGTGPLPGSPLVYDRAQRTMQPCTAELCPYASTAGGRLVNNPPYNAYGGWTASINANSNQVEKDAMFRFLSHLASSEVSQRLILGGGNAGLQSFRQSHFKNVAAWIDAGIDGKDAGFYLNETQKTLNSPNIALEMRTLGTTQLQKAVDLAFSDLLSRAGENATYREWRFAGLDDTVEDIIQEYGRTRYQGVYQKTLGVFNTVWNGREIIDVCKSFRNSQDAMIFFTTYNSFPEASLVFRNCTYGFFEGGAGGSDGVGVVTFALPNTELIGGSLEILDNNGEFELRIIMDSLQDVTGSILMHNNSIHLSVDAPRLTQLGSLSLVGNRDNVAFMAEELQNISQALEMEGNTDMQHGLALPELLYTGELRLVNNSLQRLDLPRLKELQGGALVAKKNSNLSSIVIPGLQRVNGDLVIWNNADLVELTFPKLVTISGENIDVTHNEKLAFVNLAQADENNVTYCWAFSEGDFRENPELLNIRTQWLFYSDNCIEARANGTSKSKYSSNNICPEGYILVHGEGQEYRCDEDWRSKFMIALWLTVGCIAGTSILIIYQRAQFLSFYNLPQFTHGRPIPEDLCGISWDSVITTMLVSSVDLASDLLFVYLQLDDDVCIESKGIVWTSLWLLVTTASLGLFRTIGELIYLSGAKDRHLHFFPWPRHSGNQSNETKLSYLVVRARCVLNGAFNVLLVLHTVTGLSALKLLPWDRPTTAEGKDAARESDYLPDWGRMMKLRRLQTSSKEKTQRLDSSSEAGTGRSSLSASATPSQDHLAANGSNERHDAAGENDRLAADVAERVPWSSPTPLQCGGPVKQPEALSPKSLERAKEAAQRMSYRIWKWVRTLTAYDAVISLMEDVGQITLQLMFLQKCLPTEEAALGTLVSLLLSFLRGALKATEVSQDTMVRKMGSKVASNVRKVGKGIGSGASTVRSLGYLLSSPFTPALSKSESNVPAEATSDSRALGHEPSSASASVSVEPAELCCDLGTSEQQQATSNDRLESSARMEPIGDEHTTPIIRRLLVDEPAIGSQTSLEDCILEVEDEGKSDEGEC